MRRSREMIAIVVLASALAADGTLRAAPVSQTGGAGTIAGRLVQRISIGLRRTIASAHLLDARSPRNATVALTELSVSQAQIGLLLTDHLLPSHLPLPPPAS